MKLEGHHDRPKSAALPSNAVSVMASHTQEASIMARLTSQQLSQSWVLQKDGWVVLNRHPNIRLFWFPPELHSTLCTPPCLQIISTKAQTHLEFDPRSLGLNWQSIFSESEITSEEG
ncbi:hypothetical protein C8R45DRAFT_970797, partial [Mycena sanguinolenta]